MVGGGGRVFMALLPMVTGGFVSNIVAELVLRVVSVFSAGGVSRRQPSMSMAIRPHTLIAKVQNTASLTRDRRLCCSSSEPWGTNGFGWFMDLARLASFLRGQFFWLIVPRQNFPSKNFVAG